MANLRTSIEPDDLQASSNLKRIDELESFRKEFSGTEFYKKIADSIRESKLIETEIEKVTWKTIKYKIVWIIIGGVGVILIDLIIRAIPNILSSIKG